MAEEFGLSALGFRAMQQQDVIDVLNPAFQSVFGQNINLLPESIFGQIIGIISEREALVWQQAEAVYDSQYPGGAEGTSVDNILALSNLRRLPASPTVTDPNPVTLDNGIVENGLVLFGTPGTPIPAGSTIQTSASPPVQFTINSTVTIAAAVNAVQSLFMSATPTSGYFSISIVDPDGNTDVTSDIYWNALAASMQLSMVGVPAPSTSFQISLTVAGVTVTTAAIPCLGSYPTATAIQGAITALSGYSGVTVTGSAGSYVINWGSIPNPTTAITVNTTGSTITTLDSVQSAINAIQDPTSELYPYTDIAASVNASGFNFTFGANTPAAGQPSSGAQQQPLMLEVANTLMNGALVVNLQISTSISGAPAQAIAAATCTVDGPNFVAAGTINVIGTPISGWSGVTNQLDCITGTLVETDAAALVRRAVVLSANANGPLQSIVAKVEENVSGVTAALGFENLNIAALQVVSFPILPSSGSYTLVLGGYPTGSIAYNASAATVQSELAALPGFSSVLVSGNYTSGYTVDLNGSYGGSQFPLMQVTNNTTGGAIDVDYGRPGKSFEIVVAGGTTSDIAEEIYGAKPAGIQTYGNTGPTIIYDSDGNEHPIYFSRPTLVPIYVTLVLQTDLSSENPTFNPGSIAQIQEDIVDVINSVPIGGLVVGFGSAGIIGAFNSVPGILYYTLYFGTSPNPNTNTNIQLLSEQAASGQTFLVNVSYS